MRKCIRTGHDCVHCFMNQAQNMAERLDMGQEETDDLTRRALAALSAEDFSQSPPEIAETFYDVIRECSGVADPFEKEKARANKKLMEHLDEFRSLVDGTGDPFGAALKMSIVANAIDFGVQNRPEIDEMIETLRAAIDEPMKQEYVTCLKDAVDAADTILFLADNAGEVVLDRLLIETLPLEKLTIAVRGRPIINDCTMVDAKAIGLDQLAPVISNGTGIPGTVVGKCSGEFRDAWEKADLVIAKGQGNFETLVGTTDKVCYLLKVKCHTVADALGMDIGDVYVGFARDPRFSA